MQISFVTYSLTGNNQDSAHRLGLFSTSEQSDTDHLIRDRPQKSNIHAAHEPLRLAKFLIKTRRSRDRFLPGIEFGEPGWDILLDLFVAREEGRPVSASSLCIAAAVPPTTALRWIGMLVKSQHLRRRPDPRDGRRVFIELTDQAAGMMRSHLEYAAKALSTIVGR